MLRYGPANNRTERFYNENNFACMERFTNHAMSDQCNGLCKVRFLTGYDPKCKTPWDDNAYAEFLARVFPVLSKEHCKKFFEQLYKKKGIDFVVNLVKISMENSQFII